MSIRGAEGALASIRATLYTRCLFRILAAIGLRLAYTASARASPLRSRTALRRIKTTLCRGTGCQLEAAAASLQCEWWQRPLDEERTSSWRKKSGSGKQTERAGDKRIEVEVKKKHRSRHCVSCAEKARGQRHYDANRGSKPTARAHVP